MWFSTLPLARRLMSRAPHNGIYVASRFLKVFYTLNFHYFTKKRILYFLFCLFGCVECVEVAMGERCSRMWKTIWIVDKDDRSSQWTLNLVKNKIRTMAPMLVNEIRGDSDNCNRLTVDETLTNHFGAIVMAARISRAKEILLTRNINQLPYIERENLLKMFYRNRFATH